MLFEFATSHIFPLEVSGTSEVEAVEAENGVGCELILFCTSDNRRNKARDEI